MSITDELRKRIDDEALLLSTRRELWNIADRIDAEHQKALDEWKAEHGQMWLKGYSECHAELMEGNETLASDLERCGWVRLPVDADGVPIHVGDVMEWVDIEGTVEVVCTVDAVGVDCFFAWDGANGRYAQKCANAYRHHHPPTVEDVLREFADEVRRCCDTADTIAEYAAKLRLAEREDS